jgi:hypothetical protein
MEALCCTGGIQVQQLELFYYTMNLGPRFSAPVLTMFLCFRTTSSITLQAREGVVLTYIPEIRD